MAWNTVTYACGHTVEKQLYGKHVDRERFVAWAAKNGLCDACCKADAAKQRDAFETEHELPALTGSEAQVDWARDIRLSKLSEFFAHADELLSKIPREKYGQFQEHKAVVQQALYAKISAKFWIDGRNNNGVLIAQSVFKETRNR